MKQPLDVLEFFNLPKSYLARSEEGINPDTFLSEIVDTLILEQETLDAMKGDRDDTI